MKTGELFHMSHGEYDDYTRSATFRAVRDFDFAALWPGWLEAAQAEAEEEAVKRSQSRVVLKFEEKSRAPFDHMAPAPSLYLSDAMGYVAKRLVAEGLAVEVEMNEFWLGGPDRFSDGQYFADDPSREHWQVSGPYNKKS